MTSYKVPKPSEKYSIKNDTVKSIKDYYQLNFFEYLSRVGKLIIIPYDLNNNTYAVPQGYSLFITNIQSSAFSVDINNPSTRVYINSRLIYFHNYYCLQAILGAGAYSVPAIPMVENYSIPLKVSSGEQVIIQSDGLAAACLVKGFLIQNAYLLY